jgi:hypothetical protein
MPYADPDKQRAYQAAWIRSRREAWLAEHGPCIDCGSWDQLEVDHLDSTTKVTHRIWSWSMARRTTELEKCVVRCTHCHGVKTAAHGEHTSRIGIAAVMEIRQRRAQGTPIKQLAAEFGIDRRNVLRIVKMEAWSRID